MVTARVGEEVAAALASRRPVAALESAIVTHGLPRPDNLRVAEEVEGIVRAHGAVPATVGMVAGEVVVGLDRGELRHLAESQDVAKLGVRDLPTAVASRRDGATTVASTAHLAARTGIRVFATGGLGGVHRRARETWDESNDLVTLARTPIVVVCAGVKSVLDVAATLERLETLGIPVVGYGTGELAGFYVPSSGHPLDWRADTPEDVTAIIRAQAALGLGDRALIVANPLPPGDALDPADHDRLLTAALQDAERAGVVGKDVTPHLLAVFHDTSGGATLRANEAIIKGNAALAAAIAVAAA